MARKRGKNAAALLGKDASFSSGNARKSHSELDAPLRFCWEPARAVSSLQLQRLGSCLKSASFCATLCTKAGCKHLFERGFSRGQRSHNCKPLRAC